VSPTLWGLSKSKHHVHPPSGGTLFAHITRGSVHRSDDLADNNYPTNVTRLRPAEDLAIGERWRSPVLPRADSRPSEDPDKDARRAEKRQREMAEPVEPWDRYKALRQTLDEAQKFEDLADHKARFAMILMGGLNALLVFGALSDGSGARSLTSQPGLSAYLGLCGVAVVYLFHQAIEALRPRGLRRPRAESEGERAAGLRHHHDVLQLSDAAYLAAWRQVRVEQLNDQIALQVHRQAEVNRAKEKALTRLYSGLRVMMILLVGLVVLTLAAGASRTPPASGRSDTSSERMYKMPRSSTKLPLRSVLGS